MDINQRLGAVFHGVAGGLADRVLGAAVHPHRQAPVFVAAQLHPAGAAVFQVEGDLHLCLTDAVGRVGGVLASLSKPTRQE